MYGVDAITVRAVINDNARGWNQQSSLAVVRAVEGTLRSFNNLIEKLHHSTYLYVLVSTLVFTTMEKYVYGCLLLGVPLLVYAFALIYFANPDRMLHAFGVLGGIYAVCLTALLLPNLLNSHLGWSSLAVWVWGLTVLGATALLVLGLFPYLNALFPPDPAAFATREERQHSELYLNKEQFNATPRRRHSRSLSCAPPRHPSAPSMMDSLLPPLASRSRRSSSVSTANSACSSAATSNASSPASSRSVSPQPSPLLTPASTPSLQGLASLPVPPLPPPSREWESERYYWVDYASFKALAMLTVVLSLSPLGILNFSIANLAFLVVAPLLALVAPFERPEPAADADAADKPLRGNLQRKLSFAAAWVRLMAGGVVLVIFSPPSLLYAAALLAEATPLALAAALLGRLPAHSHLHITQVIFMVYCPAFAVSVLLYTLKLFSGPRPTAAALVDAPKATLAVSLSPRSLSKEPDGILRFKDSSTLFVPLKLARSTTGD
jgi:hypothetical protein